MIKNFIKYLVPGYNLSQKIYIKYKISKFLDKHNLEILSNINSYYLYRKYNCFFSGKSIIGKNIHLPHPIGIVIGTGVTIGKNVTIYQNVTIGRKDKDIGEYPIIGDDVTIYCNSIIIGKITIGKGSIIGAGSIVLRNVEPGEKVHGIVK